jgi:hypothetical protein
MSASAAWQDTPEWELDVLLGRRGEEDDEDVDDGGPEGGAVLVEPVEPPVPEALKGLF